MKVLAVGDIEGDRTLAEKFAAQADAENVDAVLVCGDIVDDESNANGVLAVFRKPVLFVPGNHDSPDIAEFIAEFYKVKNLHGYGYKKGDFGFFGCSSVNLGIWQLPERDIFELLKKGAKYVDDCKKKVLMSHVHPARSRMSLVSGFEGSEGLRKAIDELQPDIVFCAHVGEAEGIEELIGKTRVINVGRRGKIFEL
ncbi:MAG TPA: metallophosphoesterase [Candidatus Nanoarchaeia archaeon]|nr:metallophosphoesterase [Candidatus Nanoarchaeia archaeon]